VADLARLELGLAPKGLGKETEPQRRTRFNLVLPQTYVLEQNYPNPFNPETIIKYELQTQGKVKLKVLDILGKVVIELVDDTLPPGSYGVKWNGKDGNGRSVASGTYLYQLTVNKHQIAKKLLLTR